MGIDELLYKVQDAYERVSIQKEKIKRMGEVADTKGKGSQLK